MHIIILSEGSTPGLWPLFNNSRSRQFVKLLTAPAIGDEGSRFGAHESMVQRIVRQIDESKLNVPISLVTGKNQRDSIISQLGSDFDIVTEPDKRNTFPAIALASAYLRYVRNCDREESVVVIPSDTFTDNSYFDCISNMVEVLDKGVSDIVLMGIKAGEPSSKFGYILPQHGALNISDSFDGSAFYVNSFIEKPDIEIAVDLINKGAYRNGGVFAFKLGYISDIVDGYIDVSSFEEMNSRYVELPLNSFDREIVEKSSSIALVPFDGVWNDLGSWDILSDHITDKIFGDATMDSKCEGDLVVNELDIPVVCLGLKDMIVAASPEGILVSDKKESSKIDSYSSHFKVHPMFEDRRWGSYKVLGHEVFADGYSALTKLLCIKTDCNISYQYHNFREEIWTFIDGKGLLVLDGVVSEVGRGSVIHIKAGEKHSVRALSDLQIIEVQSGSELTEEDIVRLDWDW